MIILALILFTIFWSVDLSTIFLAFILCSLFLGTLYYVRRQARSEYLNELARQSRDSVNEESAEYDRLLTMKGIDSPETQKALRALIRAKMDMQETHPTVDYEGDIANLIKLVKK